MPLSDANIGRLGWHALLVALSKLRAHYLESGPYTGRK